ncbi:MAG: hypothetical protein ACI9MR_004836 [Myxococcota bacterium]|jgi:hypothetical protein
MIEHAAHSRGIFQHRGGQGQPAFALDVAPQSVRGAQMRDAIHSRKASCDLGYKRPSVRWAA